MNANSESVEQQRRFWANIARQNGWYAKPFYVIVWMDNEGNVTDSLSYIGLDQDILASD